jgi:hypothetical protein
MSVEDTWGIPEFFVTCNKIEEAGDGLIRVISYVERGGTLVPVCSRVMPIVAALRLQRETRDVVERLLLENAALSH